jgi:hypothetical protein
MDDVEFVNILDPCDDLLEDGACLAFGNSESKAAYFLHLTM